MGYRELPSGGSLQETRAAPEAWLMPRFQWMGGTPALLVRWSMSPYPGEETVLFLLVILP